MIYALLQCARLAVAREKEIAGLRQIFPDTWESLVDTMARFDRASTSVASPYVKQMWAAGRCGLYEVLALRNLCPAAFVGMHLADIIDQPAAEVLPRLARNLP